MMDFTMKLHFNSIDVTFKSEHVELQFSNNIYFNFLIFSCFKSHVSNIHSM